ncbi:MAG: serine/threonine-protein kinase [Candidatus Woesearchaeota archaeon]
MNIDEIVKRLVGNELGEGKYVVTRMLGQGGMGFVVEAYANLYERLKDSTCDVIKDADTKKMVFENMSRHSAEFREKCRTLPPWELQKEYEQLVDKLAPQQRLSDVRRAIKILDPDLITNTKYSEEDRKRHVERFNQEIKILSKLEHPNIVRVLETGLTELHIGTDEIRQVIPLHFAVMEYVDVAQHLGEKPLPTIEKAVYIGLNAIEGVIHVHEKGMLHRDIKPSNILYSKTGEVKLSDFGLAKILQGSSSSMTAKEMTASGQLMGTPLFMDPERARGGASKATQESDVYAFGATLYHLITGQSHIEKSKEKAWMEIVANIAAPDDNSVWIRNVKPTVSQDLEDLIMKMLAKNPTERPTTYEIRDELKRLLEEGLVAHQPLSERDETSRKEQIRGVQKAVKRWRFGARKFAELGELYEELAQLHARNAEEVNSRIDALENALSGYMHLKRMTGQTALPSDELDARIAKVRKNLAFEYRRLNHLGAKRKVHLPANHKKTALVTAATAAAILGAAVVGNHYYQEHQRGVRIDNSIMLAEKSIREGKYAFASGELEKAMEEAKDMPSSSPKIRRIIELKVLLANHETYDKASGTYIGMVNAVALKDFVAAKAALKNATSLEARLENGELKRKLDSEKVALAGEIYSAVKAQLESRNFSDASNGLELIKELLATVVDDKAKADAMFEKVKEDEGKITVYKAEIKMYEGLMELFGKVQADYRKIGEQVKADKFVKPAEINAIDETLDQILTKLGGIEEYAIGDEYTRKVEAVKAAKQDVLGLRTMMNAHLATYLGKKAREISDALQDAEDYTRPAVATRIVAAKAALNAAESEYDKIDLTVEALASAKAQIASYAGRLQKLDEQITEYNSWLKQAKDGTNGEKRSAVSNLVRVYIGFSRLDEAEKTLNMLADKAGLEMYLAIIDLEKKVVNKDDPARPELLKTLSEAYRTAGYGKLAEEVLKR